MKISTQEKLSRYKQPPRGHVHLYVIKCGEFIKVGVSRDINKRMRDMKLCNPYPLDLVQYRSVHALQVRYVEMHVHQLLSQWEHGREWFTAPITVVLDAVKVAVTDGVKRHRAFASGRTRYYVPKDGIRGIVADKAPAEEIRQ